MIHLKQNWNQNCSDIDSTDKQKHTCSNDSNNKNKNTKDDKDNCVHGNVTKMYVCI